MGNDYVSVDLEMTGLRPVHDSIIEIGAVKVVDGKQETFESLVKPRNPIPSEIETLTGITNEMVQDAPEPDEIIDVFLEWAEELPLLGHQISMDYSFLKQWAVNHKIPFEREGIDTLKISRKIRPDIEGHGLAAMCQAYGISMENHHRALDDAMATARLYEALKKDPRRGDLTLEEWEKLFAPHPLHHSAKRQTPATPAQIRYLKRFSEYHNISLPEGYENWTRSEMSRETDKLITKYGKIPQA